MNESQIRANIPKEAIKDYLDWVKLQITICSTALGGIVFKYEGGVVPISLKISMGLFLFSLFFLLITYLGLVDDKSDKAAGMSKSTSSWMKASWGTFIVAFFVASTHVIFGF